jgi:UDP-glucose 4-epimerase
MNVLISGGFGYIGSYMVDNFQKRGWKVGVISRSIPDYLRNLAVGVKVHIADITKPIKFNLENEYELFIGLAGANDIDSSDFYSALINTSLGMRNSLDFCLKNKIKKIIYFSTFHVYGAQGGFIDESSPLNCKNDYAMTHMFAEEYVKMFQRNYGLDYLILRPVNIYGAPLNRNIDRWSLVPNCFCKEAFEKQSITLMTSGKQIREFISLEDLVNITALFCQRFDTYKNDTFNVASGLRMSIVDIAGIVREIYQEKYGKECNLHINSALPVVCDTIEVSTRKLTGLGYRFCVPENLKNEILKAFNILGEG